MVNGKKYLRILISLVIFLGISVLFVSCAKKSTDKPQKQMTDKESDILYYTCGMHPEVKVTPEEYAKGNVNCPICNMNLTPVYKSQPDPKPSPKTDKKILYYRNPMNPGITSKVPAKDQMGMDYIPVYESDDSEGEYYGCGMPGQEHVFLIKKTDGITKCPMCGMPLKKLSKEEADQLRGVVSRVKISGNEIKLAGVQTGPVKKMILYKNIRTVGRVAYDPQLAVAEEEFVSSLQAYDKMKEGQIQEIKQRAEDLVSSSEKKLTLLGLSNAQIDQLRKDRVIHNSLILPEKKMWIYGDIYEYELSWVKEGSEVEVSASALPGEKFKGIVSSINPVLDPKTRSIRFRAEVDNPNLHLKPEMYVDVVIKTMYMGDDNQKMVLAIPQDSVLDTGRRKIVWVDMGNDEYEGRLVDVGPEASAEVDGNETGYYPVKKGLEEGDKVVTKANFLIDSQSQISGVASSGYSGSLNTQKNPDQMQMQMP